VRGHYCVVLEKAVIVVCSFQELPKLSTILQYHTLDHQLLLLVSLIGLLNLLVRSLPYNSG